MLRGSLAAGVLREGNKEQGALCVLRLSLMPRPMQPTPQVLAPGQNSYYVALLHWHRQDSDDTRQLRPVQDKAVFIEERS